MCSRSGIIVAAAVQCSFHIKTRSPMLSRRSRYYQLGNISAPMAATALDLRSHRAHDETRKMRLGAHCRSAKVEPSRCRYQTNAISRNLQPAAALRICALRVLQIQLRTFFFQTDFQNHTLSLRQQRLLLVHTYIATVSTCNLVMATTRSVAAAFNPHQLQRVSAAHGSNSKTDA